LGEKTVERRVAAVGIERKAYANLNHQQKKVKGRDNGVESLNRNQLRNI